MDKNSPKPKLVLAEKLITEKKPSVFLMMEANITLQRSFQLSRAVPKSGHQKVVKWKSQVQAFRKTLKAFKSPWVERNAQ